eukprot:TRINITY_DN1497_c0_g1_i1.p1 TRINITY_DN1497_c0_g1~~TRINITY_DN1497_c0_g1_i1.p1  ORF type:complete len:455 (-),score=5.48 TRINITY_DN1497_c0_g1_i1:241-1605(-)
MFTLANVIKFLYTKHVFIVLEIFKGVLQMFTLANVTTFIQVYRGSFGRFIFYLSQCSNICIEFYFLLILKWQNQFFLAFSIWTKSTIPCKSIVKRLKGKEQEDDMTQDQQLEKFLRQVDVGYNNGNLNQDIPTGQKKRSFSLGTSHCSSKCRRGQEHFQDLDPRDHPMSHMHQDKLNDNEKIVGKWITDIGLNVEILFFMFGADLRQCPQLQPTALAFLCQCASKRAPSTLMNHKCRVSEYISWSKQNGFIPLNPPPGQVVLFLQQKSLQAQCEGRGPSVVCAYSDAIACLHSILGLLSPTDNELCKGVRQNAKKLLKDNVNIRIKQPFCDTQVQQLVEEFVYRRKSLRHAMSCAANFIQVILECRFEETQMFYLDFFKINDNGIVYYCPQNKTNTNGFWNLIPKLNGRYYPFNLVLLILKMGGHALHITDLGQQLGPWLRDADPILNVVKYKI